MSPGSHATKEEISLQRLRVQGESYLSLGSYQNALNCANQCITLSNGQLEYVGLKARSLFHMGHHRLAAHLIQSHDKVDEFPSDMVLLAARCLYHCSEYVEAIQLLAALEERYPEAQNCWVGQPPKTLLDSIADISLSGGAGRIPSSGRPGSSRGALALTPRLASFWMTPKGTRSVGPVAKEKNGSVAAGDDSIQSLVTPRGLRTSTKTPASRAQHLLRSAVASSAGTPGWSSSAASTPATPAAQVFAGDNETSALSKWVLPDGIDPVCPTETSMLLSNLYLLKARCYDAIEDIEASVSCYKMAIVFDFYCVEALDELSKWKRLTCEQEKEIFDVLRWMKIPDCCNSGKELHNRRKASLMRFYEARLGAGASNPPAEVKLTNRRLNFQESTVVDVAALANEASTYFNNCEPLEALQITNIILEKEPFNLECMPVHIASLVETKKDNELFALAHRLIEAFPNEPISWYAAACYNFIVRKHDQCRRIIQKIVKMRSSYAYAWLLYGHSFAAEKEHDQANAAYFKCWQYMRGSHLPLVYIAVEYTCTNNAALAEGFLQQARLLAVNDPIVLNESGVLAYNDRQFNLAEELFSKAYQRVTRSTRGPLPKMWEALLNNHGHAYCHLGRFEEARRKHTEALLIGGPTNPITYKALAFVCALENKPVEAMKFNAQAQGLKPGDAFCDELTNKLLESHQRKLEYGSGMFAVSEDGVVLPAQPALPPANEESSKLTAETPDSSFMCYAD